MAPTDTPKRGYFGPPPGELGPIGFESGPDPDPVDVVAVNVLGPDGEPVQEVRLANQAEGEAAAPQDGDSSTPAKAAGATAKAAAKVDG